MQKRRRKRNDDDDDVVVVVVVVVEEEEEEEEECLARCSNSYRNNYNFTFWAAAILPAMADCTDW